MTFADYTLIFASGALLGAAVYYFVRARGEKAALRRNAETARGLEQVFNSITDYIFILDNSARIVRANAAAAEKLGLKPEEITGKPCFEPISGAAPLAENSPYALMLKDKKPHTAEMQETVLGLPLLVTISPILDGNGGLAGAVHIGKDLSEKKELENRLLQLGKIDALGRLAGGLAHEFNNILSIISSAFYMLRARIPRDEETGSYTNSVHKAIASATDLTRHLLTLSQRQVLDLKPSDLSALAAETAQMLRKLLGEKTKVETSLPAGLPAALADPAQVNKLIMSLIAEETRENRAVAISTEAVVLRSYPGSAVDAPASAQFVRLTVSDSAHQIKPEDLPQIFEPYYAPKSISLAAAYGIARQHRGWIDVLETGGTVSFEIYFPVLAQLSPQPAPEIRKAREDKSLRILLAEDDEDLRILTEKALKNAGHRVWAADCAGKALDIYHEMDGEFDVLLSDVVMPDKSGVELAEAIRRVKPGLKVVLMSGYVDDRANLEAIQKKKYEFIYKPFDVNALLLKLRG